MVRGVAPWADRVLDLFLPPACAGCGLYLPASGTDRRGGRICPRCLTRLVEPPHPRCSRCDAPRGTGLPADRPCRHCEQWPPILRVARAVTLLIDPADALVHALKYGGWPELGRELGMRMSRVRIPGIPDASSVPIVPVPTTPGRLRERGYNQAAVLAAGYAAEIGGVPLEAVSRREGGESQVALHPDERRTNVKNAFQLRAGMAERIRGRDVVLVDDVLTTGATASAVAETMGTGGARSVSLLTFARSLPS